MLLDPIECESQVFAASLKLRRWSLISNLNGMPIEDRIIFNIYVTVFVLTILIRYHEPTGTVKALAGNNDMINFKKTPV